MNLVARLIGITFTFNPCVFIMGAVILPPEPGRAILKVSFLSWAWHLTQPDGPLALGILVAGSLGQYGPPTPQLPAHHLRGWEIPACFAHSAPLLLVLHLHSPFAVIRATNQPHSLWNCGKRKMKHLLFVRTHPSQKRGLLTLNFSKK